MAGSSSADAKQLLEQLTEAIKQLVDRPAPQRFDFDVEIDRPTEAERTRQRVAFGYQALGTLSGRVSTASGDEFDVRVIAAAREPGLIRLDGLPPGADFVELRTGGKTEVLKIERGDKGSDDADARSGTRRFDNGVVRPHDFTNADPIGSIVILRNRRGPLIAFGPRLAPVSG